MIINKLMSQVLNDYKQNKLASHIAILVLCKHNHNPSICQSSTYADPSQGSDGQIPYWLPFLPHLPRKRQDLKAGS
jgi:hypothetical protein